MFLRVCFTAYPGYLFVTATCSNPAVTIIIVGLLYSRLTIISIISGMTRSERAAVAVAVAVAVLLCPLCVTLPLALRFAALKWQFMLFHADFPSQHRLVRQHVDIFHPSCRIHHLPCSLRCTTLSFKRLQKHPRALTHAFAGVIAVSSKLLLLIAAYMILECAFARNLLICLA